MKKVTLFLLIILIIPAFAFSDESFFPTSKGTVQITANFNSSGRIEGYSRLAVKDVIVSGNDMTVVYAIQILDRNRKPINNRPEREYKVRILNGVLMFQLDGTMEAYFAVRKMNYTMTAGVLSVPSTLEPGSRLTDTWMKIDINIPVIGTVTANVALTNIVCTGIEMVTVPAGTFQAYKVTQISTTTTTGWNIPTLVNNGVTWYVKGIGSVKYVSYDDKGKVESSTELHELIRLD